MKIGVGLNGCTWPLSKAVMVPILPSCVQDSDSCSAACVGGTGIRILTALPLSQSKTMLPKSRCRPLLA